MMHLLFVMSVFATTIASFPLSPNRFRITVARQTVRHVARQVGDGVNGNQTSNNGSTGGTGLGDGNGVGFAGTGNDIDTGKIPHLRPSIYTPITSSITMLCPSLQKLQQESYLTHL